MTRQEAQNLYQKEFVQKQKDIMFPDEDLPAGYNLWKHAACNFISIAFVRQNFVISWNEYKALLVKEKGFNIYEVAIINTILEFRTPQELHLLLEDNYYTIQDQIIALNKKLMDIMKPHDEAIARRIEIMSNQKGAYKEPGGLRINGNNRP